MSVPAKSAATVLYRPCYSGSQQFSGGNNKNDELRDIVAKHSALPDAVRLAGIGYVETHILERFLFEEISSQAPQPGMAEDWPERLRRRREALEPYVDKLLVCVLIRVPGTHYTIEIDPIEASVVYWEWQPYAPVRR